MQHPYKGIRLYRLESTSSGVTYAARREFPGKDPAFPPRDYEERRISRYNYEERRISRFDYEERENFRVSITKKSRLSRFVYEEIKTFAFRPELSSEPNPLQPLGGHLKETFALRV